MTDQPESSNAAQEPGSPPNDPASQPPSGSPPSVSPSVTEIVKAVLADPDFQKQTQSVKDKRIAEIQNSLGEQDQRIARLAQRLGVDPAKIIEAEKQLQYEDNMEWINQQRTNGRVPDQAGPGSPVDLAKARDTILTQNGLTTEPPGLMDHLAELDWSNPVAATLSANQWLTAKQAAQRQPTAADTAPPPGGAAPTGLSNLSDAELGQKLMKLQQNPKANAEERAKIKQEFERRRQR